jgi:hypothetical protein
MVLDITGATVQVAEALGEVGCDQLREQIDCVGVQVWRILDFAPQDILVDFDWRAAVPEGSESTQHFKD